MKYLSEFDAVECAGHHRRYALSAEWLEPLLLPAAVVYDCGMGEWPFAAMLRRRFPAEIRSTGWADLRYAWPIADAAADGVTCMEVIEHMKDRGEDDLTAFTFSGVRNLLAECFRILKPGGWLFLSTPNLSCYGCLWSQVRGDSPAWYKPHVKELARGRLAGSSSRPALPSSASRAWTSGPRRNTRRSCGRSSIA